MKVAYQGEPGAYSERAVRSLFPEAEPLPCATVRHAFSRVTSGEAAFGVYVPSEGATPSPALLKQFDNTAAEIRALPAICAKG